jgi:hypothetical protein
MSLTCENASLKPAQNKTETPTRSRQGVGKVDHPVHGAGTVSLIM